MSSRQDNSGSGKDLEGNASNTSTPTSPTDTRHPLGIFTSSTSHNEGLSESYQSTDTVRRRPEALSYGM